MRSHLPHPGALNNAGLRSVNESIIFNLIREHQPISRADLSRATRLKESTISSIVKELLDQDLVIEASLGESAGGRKPRLLQLDDTRCRVLGFSHFQGDFFAKPRFDRHGVIGGLASLQTLAELTAADASFEDLERTIGADVGLSLALLRYVNSAFFSLPREVDSVREALTLLGTKAVRRWATVMALSAIPDAPEELVALALLRARMCEMMGGTTTDEERERLFTVGLFSVADALLDARMEDVLAGLPFSEEIVAALLRHEGPKGQLLAAVLDYERGHFPENLGDDGVPIADAYLGALQWADEVGRSLG